VSPGELGGVERGRVGVQPAQHGQLAGTDYRAGRCRGQGESVCRVGVAADGGGAFDAGLRPGDQGGVCSGDGLGGGDGEHGPGG